jgi:hypothetical protein
MAKEYLGDSVYVDLEDGMLKLTTENGEEATNTILLEAEVYAALLRYVSQRCVAPSDEFAGFLEAE